MTTTDAGAARRRLIALALIPATAGLFGASVAWAAATDPRGEPDGTAARVAEARARIDALAERIAAAGGRIAATGGPETGTTAGLPDADVAPASGPPPVDVVTGASG